MAVKLSAIIKGLEEGGYTVASNKDKVIVKRGGQPVATFFGYPKLDESQARYVQDQVRKGTQLLESVKQGGSSRMPLVQAHEPAGKRPPDANGHRKMKSLVAGGMVHPGR